jgi:hypothetical protein
VRTRGGMRHKALKHLPSSRTAPVRVKVLKRRQQDARLTLRLLEFSLPEFHLISLERYDPG